MVPRLHSDLSNLTKRSFSAPNPREAEHVRGECMNQSNSTVPCSECPLLECSGLFEHSPEQLDYIQTYKQGEFAVGRGGSVVEQGRESVHLFTVLDGVLIRYRTLEDGRRQIVNFMFPGDLVGLQGAFDDPMAHSVEALLDSRLCIFDRNSFVDLIGRHPQLGYDITWLAAKEETALEEHLVALGQRSAKERVAYLAVWLIHRAQETCMVGKDVRLELPVTQAQIADMLGLSLVHTNRTLRALAKEGIVEWRPGEVHVEDMDAACEFAQFNRSDHGKRPYI